VSASLLSAAGSEDPRLQRLRRAGMPALRAVLLREAVPGDHVGIIGDAVAGFVARPLAEQILRAQGHGDLVPMLSTAPPVPGRWLLIVPDDGSLWVRVLFRIARGGQA